MIKPPPGIRRDIAPYRVFFTWDITYKCNYRCSYCNYGGAPDAFEPEATVYPGIDKWVEAWEDIYKRYGSCEIHLVGGEPFHYPGFMDLIERLSKIHTWECSTNLSWDPEEVIKRIEPGRARIGVSFHPEFVDFDTFFKKALRLKEAGFEVWSNYVAYPPIMEGMSVCKHKFDTSGIIMSILPFKGRYNDKSYPDGYTKEERDCLNSLGTDPWVKKTIDFTFNKEKRKTKGKLCRMGQMYAKIHSNGDAFNCCVKSSVKLGNLLDGAFALLEGPFVCREENCPCWKGMLVENEDFWASHWVVPRDARYK